MKKLIIIGLVLSLFIFGGVLYQNAKTNDLKQKLIETTQAYEEAKKPTIVELLKMELEENREMRKQLQEEIDERVQMKKEFAERADEIQKEMRDELGLQKLRKEKKLTGEMKQQNLSENSSDIGSVPTMTISNGAFDMGRRVINESVLLIMKL